MGGGEIWGQNRDDVVAYTLDGTITGGTNGYAAESEITQSDITWMVMGNTTINPWRIGGKSLTEEDRTVYSTNVISDNITKIVVTHGTAENITINSMTLTVSSNADFSNPTSTLSGDFAASSSTTFERPADTDWSNMYFKITYNVTVSNNSSNKFLQFISAEFYKASGSAESVATPTFSPEAGTYTETQSVTISCATPEATIYYTTDGSAPTTSSTLYSSAIEVSTTTTIKAIAVKDGLDNSEVATAEYVINNTPTCETPTISPNGGNFYQTQEIALSCSTDGATIYYTLDGNDPTTESTVYSEPFTINETTTVKAFAVKDGLTNSSIATATFTKITPMTVAEAIAALNESSPIDNAYVSGIISRVDSYNSSYNSITYWISDDGTTANQLEVYSGKGLNNTDFSSVNDLQVNDQVVVTGQLKKYNEIYEFNYNNYLVYFNRPVVPNIMVEPNEVNATYEQTDGTLTITLQNTTAIGIEDFGIKFYDEEGNELIGGDIPGWINFDNVSFLEGVYSVCYHIGENNSTQRTAYVKVYTIAEEVYSNTITIMQNAAPQSVMYQYSINGTEGEITEVLEGTIITLGTTDDIDEFTFAGWTTNPNNVNDILAANSSFTLNDTYVFYAVYATPTSYSFTITKDVFNGTSYAANNNEKTSTATSATGATMQVRWTSYQVMLNDNVMQWQKKNGYIYNSTNLGSITNVTVTSSEGTFTTFIGSTENPTENVGNGGYFKTSVGDAVGKTSALTVTFTAPTYYTRVFSLNETADSDVTISGPTVIQNGSTLNMGNYQLTNTNPANLVIEDGGQLIINNAGVQATVQKNISAYTNNEGTDNYYFIGSPVAENVAGQFAQGTYDLYKYDEATTCWKNYEAANFDIELGYGYLYANNEGRTVGMVGEVNVGTINITDLSYTTGSLAGFHLFGNPYTHDIYYDEGFVLAEVYSGYYVPNAAGELMVKEMTEPVKAGQGFMMQIVEGGDEIEFHNTNAAPTAKRAAKQAIQLTVGNGQFEDKAYFVVSKGYGLGKLSHFNENAPMLWVRNGNADYAIATTTEMPNSIPVSFKAGSDGAYTLSVDAKGLDADYLHLIDHVTGADVDLLSTPSYTFEARKTDYAARFRIVFSQEAPVSDGESFAYVNGGRLVIENEGAATVQITDIAGRVLRRENIQGGIDEALNLKPGMYIVSLLSQECVRSQKLVVE